MSTEGVLDAAAAEDWSRARAGERDERENRAGDSDEEADDGEEDKVPVRVGVGGMEEGLSRLFRLRVMVVDGGASRHFRRLGGGGGEVRERQKESAGECVIDLKRENPGEVYAVRDRECEEWNVVRLESFSFSLLCSAVTPLQLPISVVVPAQEYVLQI